MNKSSDKEYEKWCPEFNKITRELSKMIFEYKKLTKKPMTKHEILNGFDEMR